jgi:hypothetical protein
MIFLLIDQMPLNFILNVKKVNLLDMSNFMKRTDFVIGIFIIKIDYTYIDQALKAS